MLVSVERQAVVDIRHLWTSAKMWLSPKLFGISQTLKLDTRRHLRISSDKAEWQVRYQLINCLLQRSSLLQVSAEENELRNCGYALLWRHNGHDGVSNHQPHHCLLNRLFGRRSNKTSKLRATGHCTGNSPGTGEFPAQMASNGENVSTLWRHHGYWM